VTVTCLMVAAAPARSPKRTPTRVAAQEHVAVAAGQDAVERDAGGRDGAVVDHDAAGAAEGAGRSAFVEHKAGLGEAPVDQAAGVHMQLAQM